MKPNAWLWLGLVLPMLLSACRKEREPAPVNKLVAVAGADRTVPLNAPVQLDGSASRDGNGKAFAYTWRFTSRPNGSRAALSGAVTATPVFTPDVAGAYVVELRIANAGDHATDYVMITAEPATGPSEPVAGILDRDILKDRHLADVFADPAKPDYLVTADVKVGGRLSLAPGVVVAFEAGKGLLVLPHGSLVGKGTAERPVVFTGKSPARGYWKGLWVYGNHPDNELAHATVAYGGSHDLPGNPGTKANLVLVGSASAAATLKVTHSRFTHGDGYGLYVLDNARLTGFADNVFADNAGPALFVPAGQVHRLDATSRFTGNNGWDGIETRGTLHEPGEVTWPAFADGSPYRVTGFLTVTTGLSLAEGAVLRFVAGSMLDVMDRGFLHTLGTAGKPVVFTAATPTAGNYWGGIFIDTPSERNQLHYAKVAYAGGKDQPGYLDANANVQVSNTGRLSLRHSTIEQGTGWGVVAYTNQGAQLNADAATVNQFSNLTRGNLKLTSTEATAPLAGEWLDAWSFRRGKALSDQFYDRATGQWFNAAADPWSMTPRGGIGLRIDADGRYVWTIAEYGPAAGCGNPYSADYITGNVTANGNRLTFVENYWRSKFYNPCDPSQSADTDVMPGSSTLPYEIFRGTGPDGVSCWVLRLTNPDNSSFKYYRGL
jgi:hypothetical protein